MLDWTRIDKVFLDLDGTLLDLHFDNHFWRHYVPECYARARAMPLAEARAEIYARYRSVEGTLAWYCVDHWSQVLDLDIVRLKEQTRSRIAVHPQVPEFLDALARQGKRRVLVTNAHPKSLSLKMQETRLAGHLERLLCAHDLGAPKEALGFWTRVQPCEPFDPERTLFIDDNLGILRAARAYGFRHLLAVCQPDSQEPPRATSPFPAITTFANLLPGLG